MIDVIIVGGGPAGLTAASYLRRFHRSCVVLDAGHSRARWIPESNNCPGFPQGVSGEALLRRLRDQAAAVDVAIEQATVDRIVHGGDGFEVLAGERRWQARRLILATGVTDRLPDDAWVEPAVASGALRLCSICDAYEASDLAIGVYGPSAAIGAHALFLRAYSSAVHALPTDDGDGGAAGEEARTVGVEWLPGGGRLAFDGRRCTYSPPGQAAVGFDTVYAYLGCDTSAAIAAAAGVELTEDGEIIVDADQQTRLPGLYAIGDIVSGLNQISVAVGYAAIAATHAHNALPFVARAPV
ncbi:NAD(P)/FAD-dependent oxidoreductase [Luteimonas terricola]|uniref:Pyridine nucleotide-disulfide oxidoreductase n=1 Tax=Luteimonas terricola TaxID=645597 RepID=A0ABQ2EGD1_9GAMM|nr:NAD(P)/FAD-dependent oxidoreductase [Luteimonas terricola]GGK06963.1 pyridine nucleotide-disulfide oxidoreductase [Luteimonas terricola]